MSQWFMRWDELFAELEAEMDGLEAGVNDDETHEMAVAEAGSVKLADRMRAAWRTRLTLGLSSGERQEGEVVDVGADWVLLRTGQRQTLVPVAAISWISGLGRVAPTPDGVERELRLTHALRALAQAEEPVRIAVANRDLVGVIVHVGADHLVVVLESGAFDHQAGNAGLVLPLTALLAVTQ